MENREGKRGASPLRRGPRRWHERAIARCLVHHSQRSTLHLKKISQVRQMLSQHHREAGMEEEHEVLLHEGSRKGGRYSF